MKRNNKTLFKGRFILTIVLVVGLVITTGIFAMSSDVDFGKKVLKTEDTKDRTGVLSENREKANDINNPATLDKGMDLEEETAVVRNRDENRDEFKELELERFQGRKTETRKEKPKEGKVGEEKPGGEKKKEQKPGSTNNKEKSTPSKVKEEAKPQTEDQPPVKEKEKTKTEKTKTEKEAPKPAKEKSDGEVKGKELPNKFSYSYKSDLESKMIKLINDYRQDKGLSKLEAKGDLNKSARYKSLSMLQLNYFNHQNPNFPDKSFSYLIFKVFKYGHYSSLGENIAFTSSVSSLKNSIETIFKQLKKSPGHNKNMLSSDFKNVGIGVVYASKSGTAFNNSPVLIVTQHFAR